MHQAFRARARHLSRGKALGLLLVASLISVGAASSARREATRRLLHTHLIKSEPAANDTLAAPPTALRLWFSEQVELPVTNVKLSDARGAAVALAPLTRPDTGAHAPIVAALGSSLAPGSYVVNWSTAARDGHPAKGSFSFIVSAAR
jgi:hypothetical protein